ncbi:MAG: PilN domain-containing protein [bacterium]
MKHSIFNINIYKPETKKKKEWKGPSEEAYRGFMIILSFLLLLAVCSYLLFGLYIPQKRNIEEAHSEADTLEQELQRTKAIAQNLTGKKDLYLQIMAEAVAWPEKLFALSRTLPENIWFSKVEFPGRSGKIEGGQKIVISGWTFSGLMEENLDQIGDLLTGLNQSAEFKEEFDSMLLEFTKKSETEPGMIQFQIKGKAKDLSK